jgi:hypothetical protein
MSLDLVVMAAGIGSRFGGLKQAEPVGSHGEMLLEYSVFDALAAGVDRVVFVIRREIEREFRERVGRRLERRAEVVYAHQELDGLPAGFRPPPGRDKPWGTGHALVAAAPQVRGPFLVVNADDFYGSEGFRLLAAFLAEPTSEPPGRYAMVAYRLGATLSEHGEVSRGVCAVSAGGNLEQIVEHTRVGWRSGGALAGSAAGTERPLSGSEPVSVNFWGFRPSLFPHLEVRFVRFLRRRGMDPGAEFYLPTAVGELISEGLATVRVLPTSAAWLGVTYREDLPGVARRIRELTVEGEYPEPLWS